MSTKKYKNHVLSRGFSGGREVIERSKCASVVLFLILFYFHFINMLLLEELLNVLPSGVVHGVCKGSSRTYLTILVYIKKSLALLQKAIALLTRNTEIRGFGEYETILS